MKLQEAVYLLQGGAKSDKPQRWADLGCGNGTFTLALAELLAPGSEIIAVDIAPQKLPKIHYDVKISFLQANFASEHFILPNLDGILMANALHFVKEQRQLLQKFSVNRYLFVEYDRNTPSPWIPYPLPENALTQMLSSLGYNPFKLSEMPSRFGGQLYSLYGSTNSRF